MVRAGAMRHKVRIERQVRTKDAAGQPLSTWELVVERRAAIERTPGREFYGQAERDSRVPAVFRLRYVDGVTPAMRLVHGGRVYNILSAVDMAGLKEELVITAEDLLGEMP